MKTKYLWRNLFREIRRTLGRFLSIFAISVIGVAFFAGVRASGPDMKLTADTYLDGSRLSDISVLSTAGLSEDDLKALREIPSVEAVQPQLFVDAMLRVDGGDGTEANVHLISMPFAEEAEHPMTFSPLPDYGIDMDAQTMNLLTLTEGRLPEDDHEIAVDDLLGRKAGMTVGDHIYLTTDGGEADLYVTGFVESPKYISTFDRGTSSVGNGDSDGFAYASGNALGKLGSRLPMMSLLAARYTQAEIVVSGAAALNCFSDAYGDLIDSVVHSVEAYGDTTDATWYVYTRMDNPGYTDYSENTERIAAVGTYFPLIFLLVALLVALTTMTRMVEEQRIQMGTLKALGYAQRHIVLQYLMYAILASLSGSILGASLGFQLFPTVIGSAYGIMYRLPNFQTPYWPDLAVGATLAVVGCVTFAAAAVSFGALHEVPAALMRPKAPKVGKRVLLERVTFLWKHLSFTSKVTIRNLFRYKKRFFMSVIGIAGSCALLVTGFGLSDSIYGIAEQQFSRLWTMDMQAYTYDAMLYEEMAQLVGQADDGTFFNTAYCYDKPMSGGVDDNARTDVHLFMAHDPEVLTKTVHLTDNRGDPITMTDDGVVITKKLSILYGLGAGDTVTLISGEQTYHAKVTAVTENYVYHYVYFTPAYYEQVVGETAKYNCVFTNIEGLAGDKTAENAWSQKLLSDSRVYSVMFLSDLYVSVWNSLSVLNYVVGILILSAAALAFVVMLNLTNINITERRRELATLRVLGFVDREMYDYVFRENNALAFIGTAVGLVLGKYLHRFVIVTCEVDMVMFVRQVEPMSYLYSALMSVAFALLVNLFMRRKVRSVDMVESLKSAE